MFGSIFAVRILSMLIVEHACYCRRQQRRALRDSQEGHLGQIERLVQHVEAIGYYRCAQRVNITARSTVNGVVFQTGTAVDQVFFGGWSVS